MARCKNSQIAYDAYDVVTLTPLTLITPMVVLLYSSNILAEDLIIWNLVKKSVCTLLAQFKCRCAGFFLHFSVSAWHSVV